MILARLIDPGIDNVVVLDLVFPSNRVELNLVIDLLKGRAYSGIDNLDFLRFGTEKAHDIAVLKLLGARASRIGALVLEQAWATAILGYGIALAIGSEAFPHFPRRVVLTETSIVGVGLLLLVVSTLASIAGVTYALRIDPGPVLES